MNYCWNGKLFVLLSNGKDLLFLMPDEKRLFILKNVFCKDMIISFEPIIENFYSATSNYLEPAFQTIVENRNSAEMKFDFQEFVLYEGDNFDDIIAEFLPASKLTINELLEKIELKLHKRKKQ